MKSSFVLTIFIALLVGCGTTPNERDELGYRGTNSGGLGVSELLSQFRSDPNVDVRVNNGWQIADVKSEKAIYSFTPETHSAHPSYVKRKVVNKDGSIYIDTSVRCGAEKSVCDQLVRDFIELNNKVRSDLVGG